MLNVELKFIERHYKFIISTPSHNITSCCQRSALSLWRHGMDTYWHYCLFLLVGALQTLHWRHTERNGVSNHQPHECLLNRLFRHRCKKTSKLCVTGLCEGNSPMTGEFPAQKVSIWWRHNEGRVMWSLDIIHVYRNKRLDIPSRGRWLPGVIWDASTLMWRHLNKWLILDATSAPSLQTWRNLRRGLVMLVSI